MLTIDRNEEQSKKASDALSKLEFERSKLLLINKMVDALLEEGKFPRTRGGVDDAREAALERMCVGKHKRVEGLALLCSPPKYRYVCVECGSVKNKFDCTDYLNIPHKKH